ncbi:hypothetical protein ACFVZM_31135 [Streptomyces sioyaensis]
MDPFLCWPSGSSGEETLSAGMESRSGADFGIAAAAFAPASPPGAPSWDG